MECNRCTPDIVNLVCGILLQTSRPLLLYTLNSEHGSFYECAKASHESRETPTGTKQHAQHPQLSTSRSAQVFTLCQEYLTFSRIFDFLSQDRLSQTRFDKIKSTQGQQCKPERRLTVSVLAHDRNLRFSPLQTVDV
eukprot:g24239.t1